MSPKHIDAGADLVLAKARLPALRAAFDMFQHIPTKERLRGRAVAALSFYHAMTVRPLVEALRIRYCPHLRGFGRRCRSWTQRVFGSDFAAIDHAGGDGGAIGEGTVQGPVV